MSRNDAKPFRLQLELEFLDRLSEPVRDGRAKSVSDIIRTALARYDFANIIVLKPAQLQISVRLPAMIRQNLRRIARTKHTSVGQLVRAAVEAYLPQLESGAAAQLEIPSGPHRNPRRAQSAAKSGSCYDAGRARGGLLSRTPAL
jgi:Arc/MetJ-type ribon-helix-helix transcriptional regulator